VPNGSNFRREKVLKSQGIAFVTVKKENASSIHLFHLIVERMHYVNFVACITVSSVLVKMRVYALRLNDAPAVLVDRNDLAL
jgi:hypothetical protein